MADKPISLARRLVFVLAAAVLAAGLSAGEVRAQKPDFAGSAAGKGGRSDEAKEHAKERGEGKKKGLYKETDEENGKKGKKDKKGKKAKKDKKAKKAKGKKDKD